MTATMVHLDPFTLLKSPDGQILSFRHRVLAAASRDAVHADPEGQAVSAIRQLVEEGRYSVADGEKPSLRTCLECGCTDQFGCDEGCTWAEVLLCSRCAGVSMPRPREAIEADVSSVYAMASQDAGRATAELLRVQSEILLDIRDALFMGAQESAIAAYMAGRELEERRIVTPSDILR